MLIPCQQERVFMPDTFQAVLVFLVALMPGALYTWAFERVAGAWGVSLSDRLLRFIGVSVGFQLLWAPELVLIWREFIHTGKAAAGDLPLWLWLVATAYVVIPFASGTLVGWGTRRRKQWAKMFTGPAPAPRAWDHLFSSEPDGWIRIRLKPGTWLGGAFSKGDGDELGSYAAGYPDPQDLYLAAAADVDPDSGEFQFDDDGLVRMRNSGILVQWDQVEYLEFNDA
jgi:hypothetical protein